MDGDQDKLWTVPASIKVRASSGAEALRASRDLIYGSGRVGGRVEKVQLDDPFYYSDEFPYIVHGGEVDG